MSNRNQNKIPSGIIISAILMIVFGLAEVVTAFTHKFFVISVSATIIFTVCAVVIGLLYAVSGILILTMKSTAAKIAILLLCLDILGRIILTLLGLYPTNTVIQTLAIIIGTVIAAFFAIYIFIRLKRSTFK
jgi:hypothetical protein